MSKLGYFIYKNLGDGCLVSKYCNEGLDAPLTECANKIPSDKEFPGDDPLCGTYLCSWIEKTDPPETVTGELTIKKKEKDNKVLEGLYTFEWTHPNAKSFRGEAMLFEGLLVGAYI